VRWLCETRKRTCGMRRTHGNNTRMRHNGPCSACVSCGLTEAPRPAHRSADVARPTNSRRHSRHASCTNRDSTSQDQHKRHQRVSEGHATSEVQAVVHTRASRAHLARSGKRIRFAGRTHHSMEVRQSPTMNTMNKLYNTMPPRTAVSPCLQVNTAMHRRRANQRVVRRGGEPKTTRGSSPPTSGCIQHDNQSARTTHKDVSPLNAATHVPRCCVRVPATRVAVFRSATLGRKGAHM